MSHQTYDAWFRIEDQLFIDYYDNLSNNNVFAKMPSLVSFQFLDFESGISDEIRPELAEMSPIGRPAPFSVYGGAKNQEISFNCTLMDEDYAGQALDRTRFLRSLVQPWNRAFVEEPYLLSMFPPPRCLLFIGQADILVRGYVRTVEPSFMTPLTAVSDRDMFFIENPDVDVFDTSRSLVPGQVQCAISFIADDSPEAFDGTSYMARQAFGSNGGE